jgi:predicted DsbA family dithiol-disulfide isomerase
VEVERLQHEHPDVNVRWVPFFLDPTIPPEGRYREPTTTPETPKSHLELRGEASGILFRRGRRFTPNTHRALQLQEYAYAHGLEGPAIDALHRQLFKAHFDDHADISNIDVLTDVASHHGMAADDVRDALITERFKDDVDAGIAWSRAVGVTGIPTFIFNEKYAIVGAQEYPAFEQVMARLREETNGRGEG